MRQRILTLENAVLHLCYPGNGFETVKKAYVIVPSRDFPISYVVMTHPFYDFTVHNEALRFEFDSIGKQVIPKVIVLSSTDLPNIYSLTLANLLFDGSLDDTTVSDNGDMEKVLATVLQCITIFLNDHPNSIVAFSGSSVSRTRLYQIAIARELQQSIERFNIWGLTRDAVEPFQRNKLYEGFLISFKNVNID